MPKTVASRRFWAITAAVIATGPFASHQLDDAQPLLVAAVSVAAMVLTTWLAEASEIRDWPQRLASLSVGISLSVALLPWTAPLAAWLVVLAFLAVAIANPSLPMTESTPSETEPDATVESPPNDEDDPSLVASQTRRVDEGYETIEGLVLTPADGPAHVVFHPPLATTPEIELYDVDGCEPRLAEATPYGFRVTTKQAGRVAFTAAAPAA